MPEPALRLFTLTVTLFCVYALVVDLRIRKHCHISRLCLF
jgi:hypothetical protein